MPETQQERADRLAAVAAQLAARVRDEQPEDVHRWLASVVDDTDLPALAVVLACAVPVDRAFTDLTSWAWDRRRRFSGRELRPCGTVAAARRHTANGEDVCDECKPVVNKYDRVRKRVARAAAKAPVRHVVVTRRRRCVRRRRVRQIA